jgi:hypothetical protein
MNAICENMGLVRSTKMVDRLQPGEHAALGDALEVVLANVEHRSAQIKFVEELSDEDVHLQHVGHVLALDVSQDVDEPLAVPAGCCRLPDGFFK